MTERDELRKYVIMGYPSYGVLKENYRIVVLRFVAMVITQQPRRIEKH